VIRVKTAPKDKPLYMLAKHLLVGSWDFG